MRKAHALIPLVALASLTAWAAPAGDDLAQHLAPQTSQSEFPPPENGTPLINPSEPGLPQPGPLAVGAAPPAVNAPLRVPTPADPAQFTLLSQVGRLLTVWSRSSGSTLWAYFPRDTAQGFDDLREWTLERGTESGRVRFRNVQLGSCIGPRDSKGFPYLTHNKAFCEDTRGDFSLLPVTGGGFVLQSRFTSQCVRLENTNLERSTRWARSIAQTDCSLVTDERGHVNPEFIWSFSAPISNAYAHTAKAELRPAPPPPPAFDPDHPDGPPPADDNQGVQP